VPDTVGVQRLVRLRVRGSKAFFKEKRLCEKRTVFQDVPSDLAAEKKFAPAPLFRRPAEEAFAMSKQYILTVNMLDISASRLQG
jgi:hypothetical protein